MPEDILNPTQTPSVPASARRVIDALEDAGFETWMVGGCVRDALLGRPVNDIDLTCAAPWQDTQRVCETAGMRTFETGVAHGTLTVEADGRTFEVTTFRTDGAYSDARHPDSVSFVTDISEDLARRDFTMNAIAFHPDRGLLDPFGGRADIEAGTIRAVGDPTLRFREDALRILRGVRFASQLGFSIEPATEAGMLDARNLLRKVSAERVSHELDAMLLGDHIHDAIMAYPGILETVIPELGPMRGLDQLTKYHIYDVLEHSAWACQLIPATLLLRWTALLHDVGKPSTFFTDDNGIGHFYGHAEAGVDIAAGALKRLKKSPRFIHDVRLLVRYHDTPVPAQPKYVKHMLRMFDGRIDLVRALCDVKRADSAAHAPRYQSGIRLANDIDTCLDEIVAKDEAFTLNQLALNGNDIIALGVAPGPEVGRVLHAALAAVIDGKVPNVHDDVAAYVRDRLL